MAFSDPITIISGTDRGDSNTRKIARIYQEILRKSGKESELLSLEELPEGMLEKEMYGEKSAEFQALLKRYIEAARKFVFIVPEYNGSFPGILKVFIDNTGPAFFRDKKAVMVGLSAGFNGNLRGMDHLTGILHYLEMEVLPVKPKLSFIEKNLDDTGVLLEDEMQHQLQRQAERLIEW